MPYGARPQITCSLGNKTAKGKVTNTNLSKFDSNMMRIPGMATDTPTCVTKAWESQHSKKGGGLLPRGINIESQQPKCTDVKG
eukprot:4077558-Amphidinium_carterae.1